MPHYFTFPDWIRPEIIPGLPLRWYGLMYILAFSTTYFLFQRQIKEKKLQIDKETVSDLFFWCIIGLIIGARLFSVLLFTENSQYWLKPWLIFWPFDSNFKLVGLSGMNYYGGVVGAIIAFFIYSRRKKLDSVQWGDMFCTGIPLGYTFGRIGNFINAELYGRVTGSWFGTLFPYAERVPLALPQIQKIIDKLGWQIDTVSKTVTDASGKVLNDVLLYHGDIITAINLPRHPTQLYECLFEGPLLWAAIWFYFRKKFTFKGAVIGIYILGYGLVRFFIDYFRMPLESDFALRLSPIFNPPYLLMTPWNFLKSQIYSIIMIAGGIISLYMFYKRSKKQTKLN